MHLALHHSKPMSLIDLAVGSLSPPLKIIFPLYSHMMMAVAPRLSFKLIDCGQRIHQTATLQYKSNTK